MGGHVDVVALPTSTYAPVREQENCYRHNRSAAADRRSVCGAHDRIEQGVNVVAAGYRMLIAPKVGTRQIAFWDNALARVTQTEA